MSLELYGVKDCKEESPLYFILFEDYMHQMTRLSFLKRLIKVLSSPTEEITPDLSVAIRFHDASAR